MVLSSPLDWKDIFLFHQRLDCLGVEVEHVKQFLAAHDEFIRDTIYISGVKDTQGSAHEIFAVMVGLGRNIQDYSSADGDGKRPNAEIVFDPALGFNYGALSLRAKNKNLSGMSGGREILINRGVVNAEAGGRHFAGPMDAYLQKFVTEMQPETNISAGGDGAAHVSKDLGAAAAQEPQQAGVAQVSKQAAVAQVSKDLAAPTAWQLEVEDPPLKFTLEGSTLMMEGTSTKNKQIPKNMFLAQWVDGEARFIAQT
jgi:hypothetical protein